LRYSDNTWVGRKERSARGEPWNAIDEEEPVDEQSPGSDVAEAAERTKLGVITRPGRSTRKLRKYLAVIKINLRDWKEEALEKKSRQNLRCYLKN